MSILENAAAPALLQFQKFKKMAPITFNHFFENYELLSFCEEKEADHPIFQLILFFKKIWRNFKSD